ncbi:Hypothetical protein R9X50_00062500 [Acrodontium crateriforme]|uniref:F-box domain-containing protein n=1 Tax=Acrodontium crateriforme TaxID=150365 RepID=A0AAQ3LZ50_9PEZI|nr:Hypothetical protein R9X50_00062500 [Acrodontium crateriforme]
MDHSTLRTLPHELLEAIVIYLSPKDTIAFGATCKAANTVTYEPLVWRRHCVEGWKYWNTNHELKEKLERPPAQTKWKQLFEQRHRTDKQALDVFEELLLTQQYRIKRLEEIAELGYDVKDLMLKLREETPDDAGDVLARRYHANVVIGRIHRVTALEKWSRLARGQMVRLEEVLGAYDLFVLAGNNGDLGDIDRELDRLASLIRASDPDFNTFTIRKKALRVAEYLRSENLVGNPNPDNFHALPNNFIGIALLQPPHSSLPLQSVAIYCAVARRLGINAKPSNYPGHVHAVIEAPRNETLDGASIAITSDRNASPEPLEMMHMDPWRSANEVSSSQLTLRLMQMGAPQGQLSFHLRPTTYLEMALRTGRNIMNSVQESRDARRGVTHHGHPELESAWYSMLWSMMVLGTNSDPNTLHRRRQCLPYLIEHHQAHFPEDVGLLENIVAPMFTDEREHRILMHLVTTTRREDENKKTARTRHKTSAGSLLPNDCPGFKIGTHFRHKRFGYYGIIVGWDFACAAEQRWIQQMRVDELPRGRDQPFYNVVADDKSIRYVAEENIDSITDDVPSLGLMALAGRYFKRWDAAIGRFVSNIKDEYPDD